MADLLRWNQVMIQPGGMHTLMSFLGSIGNLMKGTGVEVILSSAFIGIPNMLNDKTWPNALRRFRMVVTLLLRQYRDGKNNIDQIQVFL